MDTITFKQDVFVKHYVPAGNKFLKATFVSLAYMVKASQYHKVCHFKRYHLTVNLSEVCGSNMMSLSQYLLWLKIKVKVNKVENRQGSTGKYQTDRTKVYYAPDHSIWGGMSKKMSLSLIAKVKTDNRQTDKKKDRTKTSKVILIVKIYFKVDNRVNRQTNR